MASEAFVTLATTDSYALGALVLARSIRQVGTKRNLVVLISKNLSDLIRNTLEQNFDEVHLVEELNSNDEEHLKLLSRPELGITFTKINCWLLEKYSKCVFLDADCLVLRNIDDLFEREEFSAAPDAGWPDCFNSGVFVYRPSKETFQKLMTFGLQENATFDGGDQGLLNNYFSNWSSSDISRHLPFTYNVTANAFYSYLPAVTKYRHDIHIVHFAGSLKPWHLTYNTQNQELLGNLSGQNDIQRDFLSSWWRTLYEHVWPQISQLSQQSNSTNMPLFTQQHPSGNQLIGSSYYGNIINDQEIEPGSAAHRRAWEAGQIDYLGQDSFSNIQQQLEHNIAQHLSGYDPSQTRKLSSDLTKSIDHSHTHSKQIPSILKHITKESTADHDETRHTQKGVSEQSTRIASYETPIKQQAVPLNAQKRTSPTKDSFDQVTVRSEKQSSHVSQLLSKQETSLPQQGITTIQQTSTKQITTNVDQPIKERTSYPEQRITTVHQTTTKQTIPIREEKTTLLEDYQKSNIGNISSKDTRLPFVKETTTVLKNAPEFHSKHQDTMVPIVRETTTILKNPSKESSIIPSTKFESTEIKEPIVRETTTIIRSSNDATAPLIQQTIINLPDTIKQTVSKSSFEENLSTCFQDSFKDLLPSNLPETTTILKHPTKELTQHSLREQATSNVIQSSLKEKTSLSEKTLSTIDSTNQDESSLTANSTMATSYTQSTGQHVRPTLTESSPSRTTIIPTETSIKPTTDGTILSRNNVTAKSTNDHSPWLFDKIFVAITYTINLCYLMFLFILRRTKNSKIIHGNLTSIQDKTPANNGNRKTK